jgi:hypothetical protein
MLPYLQKSIDLAPQLRHEMATVDLAVYRISEQDARLSEAGADHARASYEQEMRKLEEHPDLRHLPRWYFDVTDAFGQMNWHRNVVRRYEQQQAGSGLSLPVELHIVRLGDIVFATNPFEYYLDYGIQIKVRSPAVQTFLVQLTRASTYLPSPRSIVGGSYGSVPGSFKVGPEGGQQLAEYTVGAMRSLWDKE